MLAQHRTQRLLLHALGEEHIPELHRMHSEARTMATLGGVRTLAETTAIARASAEHWQQYGFGLWMAYDVETGRFAGRGGLKQTMVEGQDLVEVVYGFLPEHWGRGLATELAAECVRVGFQTLRLRQLACFTLTTNTASQRVMQKVGFCYARDFEHAGLPHQLFLLPASLPRGD